MAGMKLATAYYELVPSMGGAQGQITQELTGAGSAGAKGFGKSFAGGLKRAIGPAIALIGTAAVGGFLKGAITEASDLGETLNKSRVIFGKSAAEIEAFGNTAAKSLGLSKNEAIAAASSYGDMFSQLGFSTKAATKMSKATVTMAADLGSFNNLETSDVTERLSAAFRGEYDSLQALIPNINAARVEQEALRKTGKKSASDLTAQEKAAATLAIVQKDGARAQGDFARTSGGLANQQKILSAQTKDLQAKIGSALVPVLAKAAKWANDKLFPAFGKMARAIEAVSAILFKGDFTKAFRQIFGVGEDSKAVDILFRIRETVISLVAAFKARLPEIKATFLSVWTSVKSIVADAVSIIRSLWRAFGANIIQYTKAAFTNIMTVIRGAFQIIRGIFKVISSLLKGDWKGVWEGIKLILRGALNVLKGAISQAFNFIRFAFKNLGVVLKAIFKGIWAGLKALATAGLNGILSAIKALPGKIRALGGLLKSAGRSLLNALLSGLKGGAGFVSDIAGKIWNAVRGMLNAAIRKINAALDFSISIPGKDIRINAPDIPQLADGGIVNRPTIALIGEAGPEAVVPLSKLGSAGPTDGPTAAQVERLIQATEAARKFYVGQREFASAVAEANQRGARL